MQEQLLLDAWQRVRASEGGPGCDGQAVEAFGRHLLGNLQALQDELRSGSYKATPLRQVAVTKRQGGQRTLSIPAVRDRVLQAACALLLGKHFEPRFDAASHAYRPGRSAMTALREVVAARDAGCLHLGEADIEGFFDNVAHPQLLGLLRREGVDESLVALIQHWLCAVLVPKQGPAMLATRGIPQGSPLSPLLANIYLHELDTALRAQGHRLVRYADDFVLLAPSAEAAQAALTSAAEAVRLLQLRLHPRKTRLTSFAQGFTFLGVRFEGEQLRPLSAGMAALLPQLAPPALEALAADPTLAEAAESEVASFPLGPAAL
ncbi:MAG: reverse transcriptase domain-containing protein, partial [Burkholderiales bacterium]